MTDWYRQLLANDFATFIGKSLSTVNPSARYQHNWHIELIAEYLEAIRAGSIKRLVINMPPRSLKSICVNVAWPAWLLGHDPKSRIITASYSSALAIKHSLDCRLLVGSRWYKELFPDFSIALGQNQKHRFTTTKQGFRYATSVGGSLTGEGGHVLIIDDPLNPKQALSKHYREQCQNWFDQTAASRLDDKNKGVIVAVMQRLHEEDLSAHLLAKGGWEHLLIPAIAKEKLFFQRGAYQKIMEEGDALHAGREDIRLLEKIKKEMGSHAFAAQYLQAPLISSHGMVKHDWLKRYAHRPARFDRIIHSWDTGIKGSLRHDPSACLVFGQIGQDHYLLSSISKRCEYPYLKRLFYGLVAHEQPDAVLVEDKASGQQLIQDARRDLSLAIIPIRPAMDKVTRFSVVTAMIEAGSLWLPREASWLADFEKELFSFPYGKHDDSVDALSQYLGWVRQASLRTLRIRQI